LSISASLAAGAAALSALAGVCAKANGAAKAASRLVATINRVRIILLLEVDRQSLDSGFFQVAIKQAIQHSLFSLPQRKKPLGAEQVYAFQYNRLNLLDGASAPVWTERRQSIRQVLPKRQSTRVTTRLRLLRMFQPARTAPRTLE
jgi:hypothetical protein